MLRWVAGLVGSGVGVAALALGAPQAESRPVVAATTAPAGSIAAAPAAPANMLATVTRAAPPADSQTATLKRIARRELDRLGSAITRRDRVAIVDFSRPSSEPRLFLVDMATDRVTAYRVSHGRGSDPTHSGRLQRFSGIEGSEATARGAYRTAELYTGQHGQSMRLDGLDADNRLARARAIVVHAAAYAEPGVVRSQGRLGRSQGCFALASADLAPVIAFLGQGRLLFADRL